jgi:hypothetical protein
MILIPLANVPNQSFSIVLDGNQYDIWVYVTNNVSAIDIDRNNTEILLGQRIIPNYPIIPYRYLEAGNFIVVTENGDYPIYTQFGVTQFMIYASQAELVAFRATS